MLVLTRKVTQRIKIGSSITITVVQATNGRVKIGIEAPDNLPVDREEVYQRKEAERQQEQQQQ